MGKAHSRLLGLGLLGGISLGLLGSSLGVASSRGRLSLRRSPESLEIKELAMHFKEERRGDAYNGSQKLAGK